MDLKLLRRPKEPIITIGLRIYESTSKVLEKFCEDENIKLQHLLRSLINDFIETTINKTKGDSSDNNTLV
jgi:hypothetical protein